MKVKLSGYQCNVCGHQWYSRRSDPPVCCAKCKTPYWNKPKKRKTN